MVTDKKVLGVKTWMRISTKGNVLVAPPSQLEKNFQLPPGNLGG